MAKRQRGYSDDQIAEAVASSTTMAEVLKKVGLVPRGGNYDVMWRHIARLGLDARHLRRSRAAPTLVWTQPGEAELRAAVETSTSLAGVLRELGCTVNSHNYARLHAEIARHAVDISHFTGRAWNRGLSVRCKPLRPIWEILRDGVACNTNALKNRLIREGLKTARCEMCGRAEWMGLPIVLELDHANGHRDDNRLENLRLLCPNCHSVTDSWRGRNIGRPRGTRQLRIV